VGKFPKGDTIEKIRVVLYHEFAQIAVKPRFCDFFPKIVKLVLTNLGIQLYHSPLNFLCINKTPW
jgi:hypothetical protein